MTVVNAYIDTLIGAGRAKPIKSHGYRTIKSIGAVAIAASDDDGSVYRIDRIPSDAIILSVKLASTAITGGTSFDLGFYEVSSASIAGAAVNKSVLMSAVSFASGFARGSETNGLAAISIGDLGKKIYEWLGKTIYNKKPEYDIAITANTVGTVAGTIEYQIEYAIPV